MLTPGDQLGVIAGYRKILAREYLAKLKERRLRGMWSLAIKDLGRLAGVLELGMPLEDHFTTTTCIRTQTSLE